MIGPEGSTLGNEMPTGEAILDIVNVISEQEKVLTASVPIALKSPQLSLSHAEQLLSFCVRYLAGVDRLYDAVLGAVDDETIDDELQERASDVADTCHGAGLALQNDVFEKVRQLGGNANRMLSELQDKYSSE